MAIKTSAVLKGYFNLGDVPSESDFSDLIDSVVIHDVAKRTELTDELTSITHTAPGTPDYAIQDLIQPAGYGFATKDEGNTVLSVILNLQTRVKELEDRLVAYGLLVDAD
jgi:predicted  nucleic acid-binding Zn-ribbon protein